MAYTVPCDTNFTHWTVDWKWVPHDNWLQTGLWAHWNSYKVAKKEMQAGHEKMKASKEEMTPTISVSQEKMVATQEEMKATVVPSGMTKPN